MSETSTLLIGIVTLETSLGVRISTCTSKKGSTESAFPCAHREVSAGLCKHPPTEQKSTAFSPPYLIKWCVNPSYMQRMHAEQSCQEGRKNICPPCIPLLCCLHRLACSKGTGWNALEEGYRTLQDSSRECFVLPVHWGNCWLVASLNTRPIVKLKWSSTLHSAFSPKRISTSTLVLMELKNSS